MLILGAILLGLLALAGLVIYLAAMVMIWVVLGVFFAFTLVIALLVGDPYVGFLCAIPATGVSIWLVNRYAAAEESKK